MTSCWAIYAISISCCVVMRVFMLRGTLSRDFRGNVVGRIDDRRVEQVGSHVARTLEPVCLQSLDELEQEGHALRARITRHQTAGKTGSSSGKNRGRGRPSIT